MYSRSNIVMVILSILLILSFILYHYSSALIAPTKDTEGTPLLHNGTATTNSGEKVMDLHTESVKGRKVCFIEVLPDYLPGRVSDKCVDKLEYKSEDFNEQDDYELIRVYLETANSDKPHSYVFKEV